MQAMRHLLFRPGLLGAIALLLALALAGPPPDADAFDGPFRAGQGARSAAPVGPALAGLPKPEPLEFAPVGADKARLLNAAIPFAPSLGGLARPFTLGGDAASRERAIDCLASAMWYEAGGDARGQRAVAQVVLNRVRHPAFPATVCGVVFQGSERSTGCQFTFTCDGALHRIPSPLAFAKARLEARAMLDGAVDNEVGLATHYHTDWVHPIWSAALDKIARVDTHLFFRWRGKWGGSGAMMQAYAGSEPPIAKLAAVSPIHRMALSPEEATLALQTGGETPQEAALTIPTISIAAPAPRPAYVFDLAVAAEGGSGAPAMAALDLCGKRDLCKVVGKFTPGTGGADGQGTAFLYIRDRRTGVDRAFWDCGTFKRSNGAQCLSQSNLGWLDFDGNFSSSAREAKAI